MRTTPYEDARFAITRGLRRALIAQGEGRLNEIGAGWHTAASFTPTDATLSLALSFWEGWADSARHSWLYYGELRSDDWPRLAADVLSAVENGEVISNQTVLQHFRARATRPFWLRRLRWFPHRHRVIAFFIAFVIVTCVTIAAFFALSFTSMQVSPELGLLLLLAAFLLVPSAAGGLMKPIVRVLEKRLIRAAAKRASNEPPGAA
jgi:hypothetical protein